MDANNKVVTRFAPSPTGMLHIGGVRTALFSWLYARKHGGTFILRIEDTDPERSTEENIRIIQDGMDWVGLGWDEGPALGDVQAWEGPNGPYRQTQRMDMYHEMIEDLLKRGAAYRCTCSKETLDAARQEAERSGAAFLYPGTCRDKKCGPDEPHVVRLKMPKTGDIVLKDIVKGEIAFPAGTLDDWIIARSDGTPTYNFCVVIDDITMGVTHVIRGDDHVANTPKQIALYQALGSKPPVFAHVPMILGKTGKKLSKRDGATSIEEYKEMGFLPEAVRLMLSRLSWTPKIDGKPLDSAEQELMSDREMMERFELEDIQSAPARFDLDRLLWVNHKLIQRAEPLLLEPHLRAFVPSAWEKKNDAWKALAIGCQQERSRTLKEMAEGLAFCWERPASYDTEMVAKWIHDGVRQALQEITGLTDYSHDALKAEFGRILEGHGLKMKDLAQAMRVMLTGSTVSPPIYETMALLGRDEVLSRMAGFGFGLDMALPNGAQSAQQAEDGPIPGPRR